MDYKEVEQLLDKFYNAHTTCPEEQKQIGRAHV